VHTARMAIISITTDATVDRHGYAIMLMIAGSIAISFGGLVQRSIEVADPWQINFYRSLGTLLATATIIAIQYRHRFLPVIFSVGRYGLLAGGLLSVAGMCFIQALTHTTVANALFVLGSIPFFAALIARIMLGERLRRTTAITMVVAACGLAIMVGKGFSLGSGFGNLMALLTAISFAIYAVVIRYKRQTEMFPVLLISSAIIIAISLVKTGTNLDVPATDIALSLFWGACLSGFVNWMFIIASRFLAAAEVTLIMLLEFALGPIWVWLFIGEIPNKWTIIGGSLIISAVAIRSAFELINKSRPEQTPRQPL
jgi:drug/metabolite transporter (DMT)-like permease